MADFTVVPEQVRDQSDIVRDIAAGTAVAADAAGHVAALDDAYGWICRAMGLAGMLRGPQDHVARRTSEVVAALVDQADRLAATAETYRRAEDTTVGTLRRLLEMVERAGRVPRVGGR